MVKPQSKDISVVTHNLDIASLEGPHIVSAIRTTTYSCYYNPPQTYTAIYFQNKLFRGCI